MSLPTGLYKIAFKSSYGADFGVVLLMDDGKLRGGDSGMAYVGTYEMDGDLFTAQMSVTRHRTLPGVVSVLGYNDVMVEMIGRARDASAKLRGSSSQVPGVRFEAALSYIAD
ncbi:MAG: GrlR family regulatory protein [Sphingobium sp.]